MCRCHEVGFCIVVLCFAGSDDDRFFLPLILILQAQGVTAKSLLYAEDRILECGEFDYLVFYKVSGLNPDLNTAMR